MTNNTTTLSKSAQTVQDALTSFGLSLQVVELSASTRTANDAALTIGCEVAQIVKSLIFQGKESRKPILVLASGANRVNEKALEVIIGEKITKADADFTKEVTGFAIGGIPPVGHKQKMDVYIDKDLLKHDVIWAAAGTPFAVFSLQSSEIVRITNGKVVELKKDY